MLTDNKNISEDFHYFLEDVGSLCPKISTGVCHLAQKEKIENCAIALNLDWSEDCIHLSIFKRDSKTDCEGKP